MNRRELLMGAGAMAFAGSGHGSHTKYGALIDETLDCIKTGEACRKCIKECEKVLA